MSSQPMVNVLTDPSTLDHVDRAHRALADVDARGIALGMLNRTRSFAATGVYRDASVVRTYRRFTELTHRNKVAVIDYLEAELIAVTMATGFTEYFVLKWNRFSEEFVLRAAPSE